MQAVRTAAGEPFSVAGFLVLLSIFLILGVRYMSGPKSAVQYTPPFSQQIPVPTAFLRKRDMKTNSVVIVFIAVLIVGVIVLYPPNRWFEDGAKLAPVKSDYHSIGSALKTYKISAGHYPSTEQGLQALVERPTIPPIPDDWVKIANRVPKDPWGNEYRYRCFPKCAARPYDIISSGPDGIEGTKDDRSLSDRSHPNSKP